MRGYVRQLLVALGLGDGTPDIGCAECPPWYRRGEQVATLLAWVLWALWALLQISRATSWTVTSMIRCGHCNRRRGGVARSRHLYGEGIGEPYGAVDVRLNPAAVARLRILGQSYGRDLCAWIAHSIGWDRGIGLIVYASGVIHLDIREHHFLEIR